MSDMPCKQFIWGFLLLSVVFVAGCKVTAVNFKDFLVKPNAVRKGNMIELHMGYTAASENWVKPIIRIQKGEIDIAGILTIEEQNDVLPVQLPNPDLNYRVYWLDKDGQKHEIDIRPVSPD